MQADNVATTTPTGLLPSDSLPLVSVITVCQDETDDLLRCVASVQYQSCANVEHVIVYRKGSEQTLQALLTRKESLVIVFAADQESRAHSMNRGIKQSSGEIVCFLSPHDTFTDSNVVQRIVERFKDTWLSAVYTDRQHRSVGNLLTSSIHRTGTFSSKRLAQGWSTSLNTLFIRKLWLNRIGGFSIQLNEAADYDFILRLFSQPFFKTLYLDEPLVTEYRQPWKLKRFLQKLGTPRAELSALHETGIGGLRTLGYRYLGKLIRIVE